MPAYNYTVEGTGGLGQTWRTSGRVSCDLLQALRLVLHDSFLQVTERKATYGQPGIGCSGPYTITRLEISKAG